MAVGGRIRARTAPGDLIRRPDLTALPRVGIAATMAVFLVVRDPGPPGAEPAHLQVISSLVVLLLAASGIIHMLTNVWDSRHIAFLALGGAGVLAFLLLYGFDPQSYLLALFWLIAEGTLLMGLPLALGLWSAMAAGYVMSEIWSASAWSLPADPSLTLRIAATTAVTLVAGSLTAAAWAVRAAQRERAVVEQLRELDGMKNSFLQAVSHELRTPLAAILGYSLLLQRKDTELAREDRRQALGQLAASARKLNGLVVDLLDVDRLTRGLVEPQKSLTDVSALIARVVKETPVGEHEVLLELEPIVAEVDGPKVERIVENLVSNAGKYALPETTISVRSRAVPSGLEIIVDDEGPGVPDELKTAIFTAFARGSMARSHSPGVGIGLSLVARFADLHGGRSWVEDRPEGGSSFRVFLPDEGCGLAASDPASGHLRTGA